MLSKYVNVCVYLETIVYSVIRCHMFRLGACYTDCHGSYNMHCAHMDASLCSVIQVHALTWARFKSYIHCEAANFLPAFPPLLTLYYQVVVCWLCVTEEGSLVGSLMMENARRSKIVVVAVSNMIDWFTHTVVATWCTEIWKWE